MDAVKLAAFDPSFAGKNGMRAAKSLYYSFSSLNFVYTAPFFRKNKAVVIIKTFF